MDTISTPITKMLGIKYPIILAGMNVAAGPTLAAAVTNAGGLGVIGGLGYTPSFLKKQIENIKENLTDKNAPFGVDLLLPKVGAGARKTNYDYTDGNLPELIEIICASGCKLFVAAVGIPPVWAVEKLHAAGIAVMNMIGAPKHVAPALAVGCDIICAQGGEGGGHTGDVATSILIPKVVDACRGKISPLTGKQVSVVAAGGIFDGRGLAMSLCLGAEAVWVGTRFVACVEAGAPPLHKEGIVKAGYHDTVRTIVYTGRPMRILKTNYIMDWENNRSNEIRELTAKGIVPIQHELATAEEKVKKGEMKMPTTAELAERRPWLMGAVAGAINDILPAKQIVDEMVRDAVLTIERVHGKLAKL
jgi:NAD(P)H-dependent flavin oxidoreductase YrpB (nitropropane dioxygenase family)